MKLYKWQMASISIMEIEDEDEDEDENNTEPMTCYEDSTPLVDIGGADKCENTTPIALYQCTLCGRIYLNEAGAVLCLEFTLDTI